MSEKRPPNRSDHRQARPGAPLPNDRDRARQARQAAEALFAPKSQVIEKPTPSIRPAYEDRSTIAGTLRPATIVRQQSVRESENRKPEPNRRQIPPAHVPRIRTWLRYGMRIAEVAEVYGVEVSEVERVLGKS